MDGSVILERLGSHCNILLLQGPMGPFFDRLAIFLRGAGKHVVKVNFNGGDEWFYRQSGALPFDGSPERWPAFFEGVLGRHAIDAVIVFGDCRPYHRSAILRARLRGVAVFVFEEGYIRPNYVTFEYGGVNAYSPLPKVLPEWLLQAPFPQQSAHPPSRSFGRMASYAIQYYLMARIGRNRYCNYRHHKPFEIFPEAWYWVRSAWRKQLYRVRERGQLAQLAGPLRKRFFLVALQVFNDSQIRHHSDYRSVRAFIAEVIASFARSAPADVHLVFKHHPMDRGHRDYAQQIARNAAHCNIADRVHYVHDLHLPTLFQASIGTVVVNSTVGISSLFHGTPVKLMGRANYDIPEVVFQGSLDEFWHDPPKPDRKLVQRFRRYLIQMTQLGGSFYTSTEISLQPPVPAAAEPEQSASSRAVTCADNCRPAASPRPDSYRPGKAAGLPSSPGV